MRKLFEKNYSDGDLQLMEFLQKDRIFDQLTRKELSYFLPYIHFRTYQEDEVIFFAGDPSQALYMIKSGIVSLHLDIRGNLEKLMSLRTGKVFGDNSLLPQTKRLYSAVAMTAYTSVMVLPQVNLIDIMDKHKKVKSKMMTAFAERYNLFLDRLFHSYQNSLGFFDLHNVYSGMK